VPKKNLPLKFECFKTYGSQDKAAEAIGIHRSVLSRIICGWDRVSDENRKRFEKALGKKKVAEIFDEAESLR
jgi:plasmid maintenance system antidote protein VapI